MILITLIRTHLISVTYSNSIQSEKIKNAVHTELTLDLLNHSMTMIVTFLRAMPWLNTRFLLDKI